MSFFAFGQTSTVGDVVRRIGSDWRVKTLGQRLLGFLPGDLSFQANEWIISKLRGQGIERVEVESRINKGMSNISLVQETLGINLARSSVLELGTGWHGIDLVLFYLVGAAHIYTIDRFKFLSEATFARTIGHVHSAFRAGNIGEEFRSMCLPERLSGLKSLHSERGTGSDLFKELNIKYLAVPVDEWFSIPIPGRSIDLFYSESVLQRLPRDKLDRVMATAAGRWLRRGSAFFHRTDQSDIHSQSHADKERWPLEYLKYPDWFYDIVLNGTLMYQNRLRESDFLRIFQKHGFRVEWKESLCGVEDINKVREMNLPTRFQGYTARDLATRSSRFVGQLVELADEE